VRATRSTTTTGDATKPPKQRRRSAAERAIAAALLGILRQGGDVRARKVRRLRAAIRAQRYENTLKLAIAAERATRET
jgi:hypothetical protein